MTLGAATLVAASALPAVVAAVPEGSHTTCALPGGTWTLAIAGPGGTDRADVVVPPSGPAGPGDLTAG